MNQRLYFILIALLVAATLGAAAPQKKTIIRFSQVLKDPALTGAVEDSDIDKALAKKQVDEFFDSKKDANEECQSETESTSNPFCSLFSKTYQSAKKLARERKKRRSQLNQSLIQFTQNKDRLTDYSSWNESDLTYVIRSKHKFDWAKKLAKKVLDQQECIIPSLYVALGLRMEERFPTQEYRELASSLYSKAFECGKSDVSGIQAGYRLGLMQIWDGNCEGAEKIFSGLNDLSQNSDYRMRIGYWRYYCATIRKDENLRNEMGKWLKREYPLSLHGLLAQDMSLASRPIAPTQEDPEVQFRSVGVPELNRVVRNVELCLEKNSPEVASQLLQIYLPQLKKAEVPFQFYWTILLYRAKSTPTSFQLLASIFRENPQFISRSTLELMYPLSQFEIIQKMSPSVDPYLVLSLIRQESAFNENAKSLAGAFGLMQLQLPTARNFEKVSRKQLYNPIINVRVGIKFFNRLLKRYQGEVELALAAYNAGPQRIQEWRKRYPVENRLLFLDLLPIRETRDYVSSIIRNYYWYLNLYAASEIERRITAHESSFFRPPPMKSEGNLTNSAQ